MYTAYGMHRTRGVFPPANQKFLCALNQLIDDADTRDSSLPFPNSEVKFSLSCCMRWCSDARSKEKNMTSQYKILNSKNFDRHPYVDKISCKVGEKDKLDFIYQYASYCSTKNKHIYTDGILGKPVIFPNYKNISETFTMETRPEVSITPWQDRWNSIQDRSDYVYLEIAFAKAVYPIRISIYEVCNPGYIIEIWAQNSDTYDWFLLWKGSHQIEFGISRLFSPPLQTCTFKTKYLKFKFEHNCCNNYTMIDAVMLIGSSELILPKNPEQNVTDLLKKIIHMNSFWGWNNRNNLTANYERAHFDINHLQSYFTEYCTIYKRRKIDNRMNKEIFRKVIFDYEIQRCLKCLLLSANKSQKSYSLSIFPDEILLRILKNLDLLALSRISQVDRRFNDLTRDPSLYTCLNLRNINNLNICISDIFGYFIPRCKYLKRLDLTLSPIYVSNFAKFLENCGQNLTHLRLTKSLVFTNMVLFQISTVCKNLKVLDLTSYQHGLSGLENLENLEYLNLSETYVNIEDNEQLCKSLQRNQRIRELNLKSSHVQNLTAIITELRNSCRNLEIINLDGITDVTSNDIDVLSGCKNLRKINLHVNDMITDDSLYKLFSSCQRLEEVFFSSFITRFNNCDFKFLIGKNLIKLCLHNKTMVAFSSFMREYSNIFEQCPKLQEFHMGHYIEEDRLIDEWKLKYPNLSVFPECLCIYSKLLG